MIDPVFGTFCVDLQRIRVGKRVIKADYLNKTTVTGGPHVRGHNTIARLPFRSHAPQSKFDHARVLPILKSVRRSIVAGYFPGAEKITVKIVVERETERLLGAQIVGGPGSAKRIDTLAAAISAEMTATEFEYLDLSYAPPVAPVWEPAQIAARKAAQAGR